MLGIAKGRYSLFSFLRIKAMFQKLIRLTTSVTSLELYNSYIDALKTSITESQSLQQFYQCKQWLLVHEDKNCPSKIRVILFDEEIS
jgi:hypothetical protein